MFMFLFNFKTKNPNDLNKVPSRNSFLQKAYPLCVWVCEYATINDLIIIIYNNIIYFSDQLFLELLSIYH